MIGSLLAYDASGNVIETLDMMAIRDEKGDVVDLVDFEANEAAGVKLRDIFDKQGAVGSGSWPEWLGTGALAFKVELDASKRITALVHRTSGHRRERAAIKAAIAAAPVVEGLHPAGPGKDIRHLVGGPTRPLAVDENGVTIGPDHPLAPKGTPAHILGVSVKA